jgi:hypothetical protein
MEDFYYRVLNELKAKKAAEQPPAPPAPAPGLNITKGYRSPDVIDSRWYPTGDFTKEIYPVLDNIRPGDSITVEGNTYTRPLDNTTMSPRVPTPAPAAQGVVKKGAEIPGSTPKDTYDWWTADDEKKKKAAELEKWAQEQYRQNSREQVRGIVRQVANPLETILIGSGVYHPSMPAPDGSSNYGLSAERLRQIDLKLEREYGPARHKLRPLLSMVNGRKE